MPLVIDCCDRLPMFNPTPLRDNGDNEVGPTHESQGGTGDCRVRVKPYVRTVHEVNRFRGTITRQDRGPEVGAELSKHPFLGAGGQPKPCASSLLVRRWGTPEWLHKLSRGPLELGKGWSR